MPDTDPERIAGILSELLDGVSGDHPAERGVLLGELMRRLIEYGLYRFAPDDGSAFAAGLNEELARLAVAHSADIVWQLVRIRVPAREPPDGTGGVRSVH